MVYQDSSGIAHQSFFEWPTQEYRRHIQQINHILYFEPGDLLVCGMGYGLATTTPKAYSKEGISHVTLQIKYDVP